MSKPKLDAATCSAEFCQSLPPSIEKTMAFVRRREWLQDNAPYCPECGNGLQQQLVDHIFSKTAKWKCRVCGHRYEKEPNQTEERLERELAQAQKRLIDAEESRDFYKRRVELLEREKFRMHHPEMMLVCDILANAALSPDSSRYQPNAGGDT